jgi:hypothetical protein
MENETSLLTTAIYSMIECSPLDNLSFGSILLSGYYPDEKHSNGVLSTVVRVWVRSLRPV